MPTPKTRCSRCGTVGHNKTQCLAVDPNYTPPYRYKRQGNGNYQCSRCGADEHSASRCQETDQQKILARELEVKRQLNEARAEVRMESRRLVRELKSKPCTDCGGRFPFECMDFDHRPGEKKTREISAMMGKRAHIVLAEIAKCDLVCANCHRIRTRKRMIDKGLIRPYGVDI